MATGRKGSKPVTETAASSSEKKNGASASIVETVRGLAAVVSEHGLSELIVDLPEATITLRRGSAVTAVAMPMAHVATPVPALAPLMQAMPTMSVGGAPRLEAVPAEHDRSHVVTSPFVGTFYRRPNPDSIDYCKLNDRVDKGAVLCIVEAMKLMNEIEADIAGTIVGVLAEDGSPVEYGQPLFKIMPA